MNGPQDVGGRHGFGPIAPDHDEPLFHAPWEARAMAITVAAGFGGHWTIDESRFQRENRDPHSYYGMSYYQLWITALTELLQTKGLITGDEVQAGRSLGPTTPPRACLAAGDVDQVLARGGPVDRDPGGTQPRFAIGDPVRALNLQPRGHTRLPGYLRGKVGRITMVHGYHVYPDTSAQGDREGAHWLYNVSFDAAEVFGDTAHPGDSVTADLWEPYLETL